MAELPHGGPGLHPRKRIPYSLTITDANGCTFEDDYFVGSAREIIITALSSDYQGFGVSCNGDTNGFIDLEVEGDYPDFNLFVYNHSTSTLVDWGPVPFNAGSGRYTDRVEPLAAGNYSFYVVDGEDCSSFIERDTITQPEPVVISKANAPYADTVDISCFGADDGVIDIEVSGGRTQLYPGNITYEWTAAPADPDLVDGVADQSSLGPGSYQVIVTDIHGCDDTATFALYEPPALHLQVDSLYGLNGWNITCFGDMDGYIDGLATGGIGPYDYLWSTGDMGLSDPAQRIQGGLVAGTYSLSVADSIGCVFDTIFVLRQPNAIGVDSLLSDHSGFAIDCFGSATGEISLTALGGADSTANTYLWESADGSGFVPDALSQTGLTAGTYDLRITDINACSETFTFHLEEPPVLEVLSLESDSSWCVGTASGAIHMTVGGGVPGYLYLWNNGATDEDLVDLFAGMYTVTITDQNGCERIDSVEVFEADLFHVQPVVTSDYNGAAISCFGEADGILAVDPQGGTGPYTFQWSTGGTGQTIGGLPAGTYSVIVNDDRGCADTASVELVDPTPILLSMETKDPLCYGDATGVISLLVSGGTVHDMDEYQVWLNGSLRGTDTDDLPAGDYLVQVRDLNHCLADTTAELTYPDSLQLHFYSEPAYCLDKPDGYLDMDVEGGTGPYYIQWDRGLGSDETSFSGIYWGTYVATVTDFNQCVTVDSAYVDYTFSSCLVIPNAFSPNGDGYNDTWRIEGLELYPEAELWIYDRWGTRVYYSPNAGGEQWDGTLNGRILPIDSYHYVIRLNQRDEVSTGNVTIVK
ncbi:MAG: gliding motility-associated C-terminal domain-containing protein [Bacteroidales bacterium]